MRQRLRSNLDDLKFWTRRRLREPTEKYFLAALILSVGISIPLAYMRQGDLLIVVWGMTALIVGVIGMNAPKETWMREIAPELIGISIGVIGLDQLNQIRLVEEDKQSVIRQLGSPSNDFALEALRIARYEQWVYDGSLDGADLEGASLRGADLARARLQDAYLVGADLSGANLKSADLQGAALRSATIIAANLENANLQGADLRDANLERAILTNADLQYTLYNRSTIWPAAFALPNDAINFDSLSAEEQSQLAPFDDP